MIKARNLGKTYRRGGEEVKALDGLTFTVDKGEFLAVLGPSGSGKTTLMNLIGLLDRPSAGNISVAGRPVEEMSAREQELARGRIIGFVFQQFLLIPTMTALQNVFLPIYLTGGRDGTGRAKELLERVGLSHRLHHLPSQLSGGEIQRIAVARALVNDPALLLADEPTGNLDSKTAGGIMELLREINRTGTTVVIVTHNTELAAALPRAITLHDGRIIGDVKKSAALV